jgi:hypothetical protein
MDLGNAGILNPMTMMHSLHQRMTVDKREYVASVSRSRPLCSGVYRVEGKGSAASAQNWIRCGASPQLPTGWERPGEILPEARSNGAKACKWGSKKIVSRVLAEKKAEEQAKKKGAAARAKTVLANKLQKAQIKNFF